MDIVLGLDAGGTKTDVVTVDRSGNVRTRERTEGLDPTTGSAWEAVLSNLATKLGPVTAAALGLPFHGEIAEISARQTAVATALFGPNASVQNDVAVAYEGAFAGADGVLVLAGTGSMAWARGPLGTHRVGGWGEAFGDEGSAHWIGRKALGRISQQLDGRRDSDRFANAMLDSMGIGAEDLIRWVYDHENQRAGISGLAAMVSNLAESGDPDAVDLMTGAAGHLVDLGLTARRLSGTDACWSFAGGAMADPTLLAALTGRMGTDPTAPILPPVGGAVLIASKAAGWDVRPGFIATLKADLTN